MNKRYSEVEGQKARYSQLTSTTYIMAMRSEPYCYTNDCKQDRKCVKRKVELTRSAMEGSGLSDTMDGLVWRHARQSFYRLCAGSK